MAKRIEDIEILPGMLVKYVDIRYFVNAPGAAYVHHWFFVVTVNKDGSLFGYTLGLSDGEATFGGLATVARGQIVEVVAALNDARGHLLSIGELLDLLEDGFCSTTRTIWEKEEVLELTVADIEKKYGCKVKIVGGQK